MADKPGHHIFAVLAPFSDGSTPPSARLLSLSDGDSTVEVYIGDHYQTIVECTHFGKKHINAYPPIKLNAYRKYTLEFSIDQSGFKFIINAKEVESSLAESIIEYYDESYHGVRADPSYRTYLKDIPDLKSRLLHERIVIQRLQEIELGALSGEEKDVVRAIALLRPMLVDDGVSAINHGHRKVFFEINPTAEDLTFVNSSFPDLYYCYNGKDEKIKLHKAAFLKHPAAALDGRILTVHDIINLAANNMGIHHFGFSKPDNYVLKQVLNRYDNYKMSEVPSLLKTMAGICFCFLDGIRPLLEHDIPK